MRVAAAASARRSLPAGAGTVVLDVSGRRVVLSSRDAEQLRDAATDEAGRSSTARDLSLLLARAAAGGTLALRRVEASTLERLARELGLADAAAQLA